MCRSAMASATVTTCPPETSDSRTPGVLGHDLAARVTLPVMAPSRHGALLVARALAGGAFALCSLTATSLVWFRGDELDTDSLLPVGRTAATSSARAPLPSETLPSRPALLVLVLLVAVAAVPVVTPRRFFRVSLILSASLVGIFVVVTALRLGVLFVPVLVCLVLALSSVSNRAVTGRPAVEGFEGPS